jgi:hypothetical protein
MDRDVGQLGEDDFRRWCTLNRLSAVKSSPDKMGWDFFVESEPEMDDARPLDRQNDLKKVLVQIKATDAMLGSARGKLSAFKLLVDADLPAFIVQIGYAGGGTPRRARLLHIGSRQIETILRTVRETEETGCFDLHSIRMSLPMDEAVEIELNGDNLRQLISDGVPRGTAAYVATKAKIRETSGYDAYKAYVTFAAGTRGEDVVDWMIGSVPDLRFDELVVSRPRFGISLNKDMERSRNGMLRLKIEPFQKGKLIAVSAQTSRRVEMAVDVIAPAIGGLSKEFRKLRFTNEFVDIVVPSQGGVEYKFGIDPNKRLPIEVLSDAIAFGVVLAEDDARFNLQIGQEFRGGIAVPDAARTLRSWKTLGEFVEMLAVAVFRHWRTTPVEVTKREMEDALAANGNMFSILTRPGLEATFGADGGYPDWLPPGGAMTVPICIEFGELAYWAIVSLEAKTIHNEAGSIQFVGGHPRVIEDGVVERSEINVAALNARAAELGRSEDGKERCLFTATLAGADQDDA